MRSLYFLRRGIFIILQAKVSILCAVHSASALEKKKSLQPEAEGRGLEEGLGLRFVHASKPSIDVGMFRELAFRYADDNR